jgi:hypothetical protein
MVVTSGGMGGVGGLPVFHLRIVSTITSMAPSHGSGSTGAGGSIHSPVGASAHADPHRAKSPNSSMIFAILTIFIPFQKNAESYSVSQKSKLVSRRFGKEPAITSSLANTWTKDFQIV